MPLFWLAEGVCAGRRITKMTQIKKLRQGTPWMAVCVIGRQKSGLAGGFPGLCYDGREHPAAVITEPDWNSGEEGGDFHGPS